MKSFSLLLFVFLLQSGAAFARADRENARDIGNDDGPEVELPVPGADETLYSIQRPWSGSLLELKSQLDENRNYVVWMMVPPQHPLDLRTSERFRHWITATPTKEMSISHNMVAWRCRWGGGHWAEGATGMTGEGGDQTSKMIMRGFGLTPIFSVFTDGYLNPVWEVSDYMEKNLRKRGVIFAAFEVSEGQCENMLGFLHSFVTHPNQPYTRFGLVPQPGKMEGGGCVTFASEMLKKAGVLDSVIPKFYRTIQARRDLVGGNLPRLPVQVEVPEMPWLEGKPHRLAPLDFVTTVWDKGPGPMVSLTVMDPEKMIYALRQLGHVYVSQLSGAERAREWKVINSFPLQARVTKGKIIGGGSESGTETATLINDDFRGMTEIRDVSRAWILGKMRGGFRLRRGSALGMPVFLMERK